MCADLQDTITMSMWEPVPRQLYSVNTGNPSAFKVPQQTRSLFLLACKL